MYERRSFSSFPPPTKLKRRRPSPLLPNLETLPPPPPPSPPPPSLLPPLSTLPPPALASPTHPPLPSLLQLQSFPPPSFLPPSFPPSSSLQNPLPTPEPQPSTLKLLPSGSRDSQHPNPTQTSPISLLSTRTRRVGVPSLPFFALTPRPGSPLNRLPPPSTLTHQRPLLSITLAQPTPPLPTSSTTQRRISGRHLLVPLCHHLPTLSYIRSPRPHFILLLTTLTPLLRLRTLHIPPLIIIRTRTRRSYHPPHRFRRFLTIKSLSPLETPSCTPPPLLTHLRTTIPLPLLLPLITSPSFVLKIPPSSSQFQNRYLDQPCPSARSSSLALQSEWELV